MPTSERRTQSTVWYLALPFFDKYKVKLPKRQSFTSKIKTVCENLGVTREQIGIVAKARARMYFNGERSDVTYDAIDDLAENGTDIIFIEKEDIVEVLGDYADKYGIALVDTQGFFTDYGKDLVYAADASGSNVAVLTDFDASGIKMADDAGDIPRLGVDDEMLEYFGLSRETSNLTVAAHYKIDVISRIEGLVSGDVLEFLRHRKIEIDAVLAVVGSERFWEYLIHKLKEHYPTRDYTRVIEKPDLSEHDPEEIKNIKDIINKYRESITAEEWENIESALAEVEGFIDDVEAKRTEIENERLGKLVENDVLLKELGTKLSEVKPILNKMEKALEDKEKQKQQEKEKQEKEREKLKKEFADFGLDLYGIQGVGPTTARKLNELGIDSPVDLAVENFKELAIKLNHGHSPTPKETKEHAANIIAAAKNLLKEKKKEMEKEDAKKETK